MLEIIFWILFGIVFYTYIGYGVLLFLLVKIKEVFLSKSEQLIFSSNLPKVTFLVAAYNESSCIEEKIKNTLSLDYPKDKMQFIFVTDGSDDGTNEIASKYDQIEVYHEQERSGKIGAINRGMQFVENEIVIFSDANAMLNNQSLKNLVRHYHNPDVGCVAGEKRIFSKELDSASSAGEGLYWKYESFLKKYDYKLHTAVGAAGELFSIRTSLFIHVEDDTILDDFIMSLRIVKQGYKIAYEADAYALEGASVSIAEEKKRKVRISAGGIQSVLRLSVLLNVFKYPVVAFQYISHRVLRWVVTPFLLLVLIPINLLLAIEKPFDVYSFLLIGQLLFYSLAFLGWYFENRKVKIKLFFVPFYFSFMNICVLLGLIKFFKGNQSVLWERAVRA